MDRNSAAVIVTVDDDKNARPGSSVEVGASDPVAARVMSHAQIEGEGELGGARVSLRGWITFAGAHARMRVRLPASESAGGARERHRLISLIAAGRTMPARTGAGDGRVASRSRLALRVLDFAGRPLAPAVDVGECREGTTAHEIPVSLDARQLVQVRVGAVEPRGTGKPVCNLAFGGEVTLRGGLLLRIESSPAPPEPSNAPIADGPATTIELPVVRPGRRLRGRRRRLNGVPSGSWVMCRFLDELGDTIGDERIVGRCELQ